MKITGRLLGKQPVAAAVKGLHELGKFLPGSQMAETDPPGGQGNTLQRQIVGLTGAGGIDDLRRAEPQHGPQGNR